MKPKVIVALLVTAIQIQGAHAQSSVGNFLTGGATVEVVEHDGAAQVVPKPERVVIHDFAVRIDAVTLDNSIAGRLHRDRLMRHGTDEDSTPDLLAKHVRSVFSKALAEQLEKDHVASASAASAAVAAAEGGGARLVVDGEFTAIDEGNKTKRKLIGFGSGASDIKTHVAVSSMGARQGRDHGHQFAGSGHGGRGAGNDGHDGGRRRHPDGETGRHADRKPD